MNNLIPANTKRGQLIFSLFTWSDLILFCSAIGITLILIFTLSLNNLTNTIIALLPGLIGGFLVLPIANYHNMITLIKEIINFYSERRIYIWKGWCLYEFDESEKK